MIDERLYISVGDLVRQGISRRQQRAVRRAKLVRYFRLRDGCRGGREAKIYYHREDWEQLIADRTETTMSDVLRHVREVTEGET